MKVTKYNKLIRDKIPDIIRKSGKIPITKSLSDTEYMDMLNLKLQEEVAEYLESGSVEELADIGEVMHAILAYKQMPIEEFQKVRADKLQKRGGFAERLLLVEVQEND